MNKIWFIISLYFLLLTACATPKASLTKSMVKQPLPEILQAGLNAHGGLDQWNKMNTLEYTIERNDKPEHHLIDLKSRKVLLTHDEYKLGFDGKEVWITPNLEAFGKGSPRFYHNLIFYFYADV